MSCLIGCSGNSFYLQLFANHRERTKIKKSQAKPLPGHRGEPDARLSSFFPGTSHHRKSAMGAGRSERYDIDGLVRSGAARCALAVFRLGSHGLVESEE